MTYHMDDGPGVYDSLKTWRAYRAQLASLPESVENKAELIERADWMIADKEADEVASAKTPPASSPRE